jgi:hypothetical protein
MSAERTVELGPVCPGCGEPWLRVTNLPGRFRCVYCMRRFELRSECPECGAHSTIARMSKSADLRSGSCGADMLRAI